MLFCFQDLEDVGDLYQDETNMAALLLYKHGHSDDYKMVRDENKSHVSTNQSRLSEYSHVASLPPIPA